MKLIDRQSPRKLYLQLVDILKESIERGEYPIGSQLPTEDQLCTQQGVSKAVVRGAMQELARKGYIRKIPGKGTFTQKPSEVEGIWLATQLTEQVLDFGMPWATNVVQKMLTVAPSDLRDLFNSETEHKIFKVTRVRFLDEEPAVHETAYISHELCPGLALEDLKNSSLLDIINKKYGIPIQRCADSMGITTLEEKEAELLKRPAGTPAMLMDRILYTVNNRVVGFMRVINVSEHNRITYESVRNNNL